jgi:hypothetical protein
MYLSCNVIFRGIQGENERIDAVNYIKQNSKFETPAGSKRKNTKSKKIPTIKFTDWALSPIKWSFSTKSMSVIPDGEITRSRISVSNIFNNFCGEYFDVLNQKGDQMFAKRAYVYLYLKIEPEAEA